MLSIKEIKDLVAACEIENLNKYGFECIVDELYYYQQEENGQIDPKEQLEYILFEAIPGGLREDYFN